jgi:hypothetical protein
MFRCKASEVLRNGRPFMYAAVTIRLRLGLAGQENEDNPPQADRWTFSDSLLRRI